MSDIPSLEIAVTEAVIAEDRLWRILDSICEWVRFADTKAGAVLAANTAILVFAAPNLFDVDPHSYANLGWLGCLVIGSILFGVSMFFAARCIIPRLSVGEAKSLIFYAHIAQMHPDSSTFYAHSHSHYSNEEQFRRQIIEQIWANSRVAWQKHKDSAKSLWAFLGYLASGIIGIVISLFANL